MSVIWHDSGAPSFMSNAPAFSFYDVAEICEPAPASWQEQRERFRAFEKKMGGAWYRHNAYLAWTFYQMKKEWWQ